jgi:hypothetical protein
MKYVSTFLVISLLMTGCLKQTARDSNREMDISTLKKTLTGAMKPLDYGLLDFEKMQFFKSGKSQIFRIGYIDEDMGEHFVLAELDATGKLVHGRRVQLTADIRQTGIEGRVILTDLQNNLVLESAISQGYVTALRDNHPGARTSASASMPVLVTALLVPTGQSIILVDIWILIGSGSGGANLRTYGKLQPDGDPYGGGNSGFSTPIYVEPEYIYDLPGIGIDRFFKCFDNVPSAGASYTITLCADLPSNNNPGASIDGKKVSAGHTFLIVNKTNGTSSVTQSFGFYPASEPSMTNPLSALPSELKDNGAQEINASISMSLTEEQFNKVRQTAISSATRQYALVDYNCSNYAIDVFNAVRTNPIQINPLNIALGHPVPVTINKSPQGLFLKLQSMKLNNDPEASKIKIDQTSNYKSPISKGECN